MTDRYADLRDLLDLTQTNVFNRDDVRALLADYDRQSRMRKALNEAVRVLESARLLCNWPAMNEAIDAAARDGRAALTQEQGGSDAT